MTALVVCLLLLFVQPAQAPDELGGTCVDQPAWMGWRQLEDAEKAHDWDRVIALQKQSVRAGCSVASRWFGLVNTLLHARRPAEALRVLQQIDSRDFEINPAFLDTGFPDIVAFMNTDIFKTSALGKNIARLEKISDQRRAGFQKLLAALPANRKPPDPYVAQGVCPFECCTYRDWTVLEDTVVFAAPESKRVIGTARKGTHVTGLTGEVHLHPEPVVVVADSPLPRNTIAFVLDHGGEGFGHVFSQGKVVETELSYANYCLRPSGSCWGETLHPSTHAPEQVWWIKIKLPNSLIGWSKQPNHFGNQDACG